MRNGELARTWSTFENTLVPSSIGFDKIFDTLDRICSSMPTARVTYPPYNIIKSDEHNYIIEVAVAGFKKEDMHVDLESGLLMIYSASPNSTPNQVVNNNYLYKGIAERHFSIKFQLADNIIVKSACYDNGMLRVGLEEVVPEHAKLKSIEIVDISEKK